MLAEKASRPADQHPGLRRVQDLPKPGLHLQRYLHDHRCERVGIPPDTAGRQERHEGPIRHRQHLVRPASCGIPGPRREIQPRHQQRPGPRVRRLDGDQRRHILLCRRLVRPRVRHAGRVAAADGMSDRDHEGPGHGHPQVRPEHACGDARAASRRPDQSHGQQRRHGTARDRRLHRHDRCQGDERCLP